MGEIVVITEPGKISLERYEEAPLGPGQVRLRTLYSGISAGTQLTAYRGTNPYALKEWKPDLRLFQERTHGTSVYPIRGGWAYEEVGEVMETASDVTQIRIGDIVYGTWGHKSTHVVEEGFAREHLLPQGLDPLCGIYSQMGSIALNAILDADIHVGETVVVFGQGVPGQIAAQLARLNGAFVVAVDLDDERLAASARLGADVTLNSSRCDVAAEVRKLTGGRGADICVEFTGFTPALHDAIRTAAYNGRVVSAGFYQGEARGLYLGEEFHHNRVQIVCSQIQAVSPALSYRWNRLRLEQTIMELQRAGKLNLLDLITHVIPFREAARAFDMIDRKLEPSLQVVLKFDESA
jgi:2-desacetyl-2-hydroxyethyl bacteriochlorophyllide A dehydrogenase